MALVLLEVLFKHKYRILLITLVTGIAAAVAILITPKVYQASASLMVKLGREYMYVPQARGESVRAPTSLSELVNAEMQILDSSDLSRQVIDQIGVEVLYPGLPPDPDAMGRAMEVFAANLTIKLVPNSHVMRLMFSHEDPELAALAVNTLIDQYLDKRVRIFGQLESDFLKEQIADVEVLLDGAERELEGFKKERRLYSFDDQYGLALRERQTLLEGIGQANTDLRQLEQRLAGVRRELEVAPPTVTAFTEVRRNPALDDAQQMLLELQLRKEALTEEYAPNHPVWKNLQQEIAGIEQFLSQQAPVVPAATRVATNPLRDELEAQLINVRIDVEARQAERQGLEAQLVDVESELAALSASEKRLAQLESDVSGHREAYQDYMSQLREAEQAEALDRGKQTNIRIIEPASPPLHATGLPRTIRLMLATFMGLVLAIGSVFALERLRSTFISPEMVQRRLGLPVLASLPLQKRSAPMLAPLTLEQPDSHQLRE